MLALTRKAALRAAVLLLPLAVLALYAPSLGVMLLHDDAPNALWMEQNRAVAFGLFSTDWSFGAAGRPVANALWVFTRAVFGWFDPAILHFWNLSLHVLATALVIRAMRAVARVLSLKAGALPLTAAAVFAFYPFSFQPVMWAGALYHPLMAVLGLAALCVAVAAMQAPNGALLGWVLVWLLLVLACLSHEAGFLAAVPVLGVAAWRWAARRRFATGALGALVIAVGYPLLSLGVLSRSRFSALPASLPDLLARFTYFAQALVYPASAFARRVAGLAPGSEAPLWLMCALAVAAILAHAAWRRRLTWPLLGLLWWAVFSLPQVIALPVEYIRNGPRLLYLPSIGVALVWGALFSALLDRERLRIPVAMLFVGGLAWSAQFSGARVQEARALTPALRAIVADARSAPDGARFLLLNLPWWSASGDPAFVYGAEGLPIYQHDAPLWAWLWANGAPQREMDARAHRPSLTQRPGWHYEPFGPPTDDAGLRALLPGYERVYLFQYDGTGPRALRVAASAQGAPAGPQARFSDGDASVTLTAASAMQCGARVLATFQWQVQAPGRTPLAVFVHGLDASGAQRVAADRDPVGGIWPLDQWPAGLALSEQREVLLADGAPLSQLSIGVYHRTDGDRLRATRADGTDWPGAAVRVPIVECQLP